MSEQRVRAAAWLWSYQIGLIVCSVVRGFLGHAPAPIGPRTVDEGWGEEGTNGGRRAVVQNSSDATTTIPWRGCDDDDPLEGQKLSTSTSDPKEPLGCDC